MENKRFPEKTYKIGFFSASIWKNYYKKGGHYFSVSISKYAPETKSENNYQRISLFYADLGQFNQLLNLCSIYIAQRLTEDQPSKEPSLFERGSN